MRYLLFAFLLVGGGARADGDKTELARIHLKAGIAYYDEGRYDEAAREMLVAYELKPVADLQYNLAQCYERLAKLQEAATAYEKYLASRVGAPDEKSVRARIENLRERAKAAAAGQAIPAPPVEKVVFKTIVVYKAEPPPPGRAARFAAGGLWGLAAVAAATGIAFAVVAKQNADSVAAGGNVTGMPPPSFDTQRATQDSGKTAVIVSGVSFGVAGVALLGGAGLWLLGKKIDKETPKVTLAPILTPTTGGFAVAGVW
jgi:hypothetical protein